MGRVHVGFVEEVGEEEREVLFRVRVRGTFVDAALAEVGWGVEGDDGDEGEVGDLLLDF